MYHIESFIEHHEIIIMVLISVLNLIIAVFAWKAAINSTKTARTIAQKQAETSFEIQRQTIKTALLTHRLNVFHQLSEWIAYANVITKRNMLFSVSLERFYCMVFHKTLFVDLSVKPNYDDLQIDTLLVRLQSERNCIEEFEYLYENFDDNERIVVLRFLDAFIEMILHINEEMGNKNSSFHYANNLEKSNIALLDSEIIDKIKEEIKVI